MCGIVGYIGPQNASEVLISGLKRLEYRGYDSAGVALWSEGKYQVLKSEGRIDRVETLLKSPAAVALKNVGNVSAGIGHTRWATHGKPTTQNAHPHRTGPVVLVHNGIIENYLNIREALLKKGYVPQSETDSELFGFLVLEELKAEKDLAEAVRKAFLKVEGSCSVVLVSDEHPGVLVGVRRGSPLVAAMDSNGGAYVASDAQALLEYTREVVFLGEGELAVAKNGTLEYRELKTGKLLQKTASSCDWSVEQLDKQGYPHFMLKEIYEQPVALTETLNGFLDRKSSASFPLAAQPGVDLLRSAKALRVLACGTSWHAALLGKFWLEEYAGLPCEVELASEFRYRKSPLVAGTVVVAVSQSGETADTLAAVREMKKHGVKTLTLTNVRGSSLAREADAAFFTSAGPEIGVAATKTFLAQLFAFLLWTGGLKEGALPFDETLKMPHRLKAFLENPDRFRTPIQAIAREVVNSDGFFFIGRGYHFPLALEGALKLKEIAYIHAEGYAAGELKHGPIAMIDTHMTVVVIAPQDRWREKTISNLEEVKARGAKVIAIGTEGDTQLHQLADYFISLPKTSETLSPFFAAPVLQFLSYELACLKGTDVDKPRNLAKSVTVE